jgi:hypothetical protein
MIVEIGTEAGSIPFLGTHKWDFCCSAFADFSYTSCGSSSACKVCYKSLFNIFEGTAFSFTFPLMLSTQEKKKSVIFQ